MSEASDWHAQLQAEAARTPVGGIQLEHAQDNLADLGHLNVTQSESAPTDSAGAVQEPNHTDVNPRAVTPKKQIKVTKTGKLLSSPPKSKLQETGSPKKRRGRKPAKAKTSPTVTIIKYGSDAANRTRIGAKIDAIISGPPVTAKRPPTQKSVPTKPAGPPKITHPFFLGKANQKEEPSVNTTGEQRPPTPRKSAVTPGKLRAETRRDVPSGPMPSFGMTLNHNRVAKQAGLSEASWPTRETTHVRNLENGSYGGQGIGDTAHMALRPRKSKNRPIVLNNEEEIIARLSRDLAKNMRLDHDQICTGLIPPEDVRLPSRLLTTGEEIQEKVCRNVQAQLGLSSELSKGQEAPHPAIIKLYNEIAHTLTPFDEGRCETQAWVQKYSPKSASAVLQNGPEAFVLKDWLQSLTVMAVGGAQGSIKSDALDVKKPPRKRRKKAVDDFIVFDGEDMEEDEDMIPCAASDDLLPLEMQSFRKPKWTRNDNVILISGPHGCGKSATVYAVAQELGFEIFEINSGTRRSGKDILDKVGDMTANHLVNHQRNDAPPTQELPAEDTDDERNNTALQNDLDSGRQGTMMNFFSAKTATKPKPNPKIKSQEKKVPPTSAAQNTLPNVQASRKSQKQSLILFEEADVLFEEDQQFWTQVSKLALQSKRPIIITCNDERQIPTHELPLAAMLRLRPIPADLATDYLLVLAGREGHVLARDAVANLYLSKKQDLRACITDLNFWCQMSIGDRKGGLEWMYQRWPPGKDVDTYGRPLRVASEDTYQHGMGFLSHNIFEAGSNPAFDKEEKLLNDIWLDWGINPLDMKTSSVPTRNPSDSQSQALDDLNTYTDALSAADVYSRISLPSYEYDSDQLADPSLPPVANKTRLSYTLAAPLLQVDHQSDFSGFDAAMYTQTIILAKHICNTIPGLYFAERPHPVTEADHANVILQVRDDKMKERVLSRLDFAHALDVLADPPEQVLSERTSYNLIPSSFDRNFSIITLDLAPYVRSIVAHEKILDEQRIRLSNLLSEGGKGKRSRTTRASRVALEGGVRETKRRDRWFDANVNFELVMATAGKEWSGMGWKGEGADAEEVTESLTGTPQDSLAGSQDVIMGNANDE